jgi:ABC-2 type transport system ATP-binding protein
MAVLKVLHLYKDYGNGRGVFDVSFEVNEGEVFGFLGPNGAGKTTTIRHLMGFSKPDSGLTLVNNLKSWENSDKILKELGYLPGEIALPDSLTGNQFIKLMAELKGVNTEKAESLISLFELDLSVKLKRMSQGAKRKLAIVTAFMHNPKVLILDEPTSGLDPIMQENFINLLKKEKQGKTILLSSHMFSEVYSTCDRIAIIKEGRIVSDIDTDELRHNKEKTYEIELKNDEDYNKFQNEKLRITSLKPQYKQIRINVNDEDIKAFFYIVSAYEINYLSEIKFSLEDYFMDFYKKDAVSGGLS